MLGLVQRCGGATSSLLALDVQKTFEAGGRAGPAPLHGRRFRSRRGRIRRLRVGCGGQVWGSLSEPYLGIFLLASHAFCRSYVYRNEKPEAAGLEKRRWSQSGGSASGMSRHKLECLPPTALPIEMGVFFGCSIFWVLKGSQEANHRVWVPEKTQPHITLGVEQCLLVRGWAFSSGALQKKRHRRISRSREGIVLAKPVQFGRYNLQFAIQLRVQFVL